MKKTIEILIVIIVLFGLALVFGCKEKELCYTRPWGTVMREQMDKADAEAKFKFVPYTTTPSTTLEWTEPYESEPIGESIFLTDPNGGITFSMASGIEVIEPNEPEIYFKDE